MSDLAVEIHKISPVDALNQLLTRRKDTGNCAYDISKHLGKTNKYSKVGWLLPVSLDKVVKEIGWTQGFKGSPDGTSGKEPSCQRRRHKRLRFHPCVGKIPWRRAWQPTPVLLPGKSHGQRRLAGYSPVQFGSVAQSCLTLWDPMDCQMPGFLNCSSPTPRACSNSCPPQFKSISFSALNFLYSPTLTSIHDYWRNHSFD